MRNGTKLSGHGRKKGVRRFDVYILSSDPTQGSEIKKTRLCLIISPDEMNRHIRTVTVATMTTTRRDYATRVSVEFQGKHGQIVLDQIRTIDKNRLERRLDTIPESIQERVIDVLQGMFALY